MSNVSAGDLAIVVGSNPQFNGRTCHVLYRAPSSPFTLPDGYPHALGGKELRWVLHFPTPIECQCESGNFRMTHYIVGRDSRLRRIAGPGIDIAEEIDVPTNDLVPA